MSGDRALLAATPVTISTAHASGVRAVERELGRLHEQVRGATEGRMVRMPALTLVAACQSTDEEALVATVSDQFMPSLPARVLVVLAVAEGAPSIDADISVRCIVPPGSGPLCAEQVRLEVRGEPARHLRSVVTPLIAPDVPVHLWLVGAPPLEQAFSDDVLAFVDRIIFDSDARPHPATTLRELAAEMTRHRGRLPLSDLAWARVLPWRAAVAQAFDGTGMRGLANAVAVAEVESGGTRPSMQAWLVAGWLASRLAWSGERMPEVSVTARADARVTDGALLRIRLECRSAGHAACVVVDRDGDTVTTSIDVDGGHAATGSARHREHSAGRLVGQLIEDAGADPLYLEAVRAAARMAAAADV